MGHAQQEPNTTITDTNVMVPPVEANDDSIVFNVDDLAVRPDFPGGMKAFYKFIASNFNPPDEPGLKGKLIIDFIIEKDGSLSNLKIVQDMGYGTANEIIRVMNMSPKWKPAIKDGKPARSNYTMPITIQSE